MSTTVTQTTVRAPLNFYQPPKDGGQIVVTPWMKEQMEFNRQNIQIQDIRGHEADFNIDKNGFQYVKAPTTFQDWSNDEAVRTQYFDSIKELVCKITGGTRVHFYGYRLRDSSLNTKTSREEGAAEFPHCDISPHSAPIVMNSMPPSILPPDWDHLKNSTRWAMFSIWRPTVPKVTRSALCVCDRSSVPDGDLVPYTMKFGRDQERVTDTIEAFLIRYDAEQRQRWYYMSGMGMEDVVFIKHFDTKEDGRARCAPHGSFVSEADYG